MTDTINNPVAVNDDAEAHLIGAILYNSRILDDVLDTNISDGDFARPSHAHIWSAITRLHTAGQPIDPHVVDTQLRHDHTHDHVPQGLLAQLAAGVPSSLNAVRYAQEVRDAALLRALHHAALQIKDLAAGWPDTPADALDQAEQILHDLTDRNLIHPAAHQLGDGIETHVTLLEARADGTVPAGIPTGWNDLDNIIGGLRGGQLIVVAARPAMGKSALGANLAANTAAHHPSLLISLEMSLEELNDRYFATASRVPLNHIRTGDLTPNDWEQVYKRVGALAELPVHILDHPSATLTAIRTAARRRLRHGPLSVIIVDYLQLLHPARRTENRQVEVAELSRGLKQLARELDTPVVALAQLNRSVETRAEKRPVLADLRESGAIEQDGDVVIGLYRDEYYKPDTPDRGVLEAIVLKQRNGPTGTARLHYDLTTQRIANLATNTGERI